MNRQLASATNGRKNSNLNSSPTIPINNAHTLGSSPTAPSSTQTFKPFFLGPGVIIGGRYELQNEIGNGGMSIIYAANDHDTGNSVAVKVIRRDLSEDPQISKELELFALRQELTSLHESLSPRAAPTIYDVNLNPTAIIMERLIGKDLSDVLNDSGGRLHFEVAVGYIIEAATSLLELHKKNIIHRDLKPSNIFLNNSGKISLMDLGLCARTTNGVEKNALFYGTVEFGAPEQFKLSRVNINGKNEFLTIVDFRSDIYSLGATLYVLLSGNLTHSFIPDSFSDHHTKNMLLKKTQPITPISKYVTIPKKLEQILNKALAINPQDRYQSVSEFKDALTGFMDQDSPEIIIETKPHSFMDQFIDLVKKGANALKKLIPSFFN